jgi:hypothetical protein
MAEAENVKMKYFRMISEIKIKLVMEYVEIIRCKKGQGSGREELKKK